MPAVSRPLGQLADLIDRTVTIQEVADALQVAPSTVRRWVRADRFPAPLRIGRSWRWTLPVISQWIEERT